MCGFRVVDSNFNPKIGFNTNYSEGLGVRGSHYFFKIGGGVKDRFYFF